MFDRAGKLVQWNDEFARIVRLDEEGAAQHRLLDRIAEEDKERVRAAAEATYAGGPFEIRAVVADLSMPDVGGMALVKVLRTLNPSMRVLAISGLANDSARQTGTPFIAKPFTKDSLLTSLRKLLLRDESTVQQ